MKPTTAHAIWNSAGEPYLEHLTKNLAQAEMHYGRLVTSVAYVVRKEDSGEIDDRYVVVGFFRKEA